MNPYNIQPGDIVTYHDDCVGDVLSEPFQTQAWKSGAWWRVVVQWEADGEIMQAPWDCAGIVEVERNGNVIGQQLSLFTEAAS